MRKAIQLVVNSGVILALCEDGSIWHLIGEGDEFHWEELPSIPVPEVH